MTTYYVDPVSGSMSNTGTQSRPWNTLANVFSTGKKFKTGDTLILLTGYHGIPVISGNNTGIVTITAAPNNTPVVGALSCDNASFWRIVGLTVTRSLIPAGHSDTAIRRAGIAISNQTAENCNNITFQNCTVYTTLDTSKWGLTNWNNTRADIGVFGTYISFQSCHFFNNSKILVGYHSHYFTMNNCLTENFSSDGFNLLACSNATITNNIIRNSMKVNGNHNDLMQCWGGSGHVIKNNLLVAWTAGNKYLVREGCSDTQGMAGFDQGFNNYTITDNQVYVDHPIGIWFLGPNNFNILNNFVRRCGKTTYFSANRPGFALPSVTVWLNKSNKPGKGNTIRGNRAEAFYINQTGGSFTPDNIKISGSTRPPTTMIVGPLTKVGVAGLEVPKTTARSIARTTDTKVTNVFSDEITLKMGLPSEMFTLDSLHALTDADGNDVTNVVTLPDRPIAYHDIYQELLLLPIVPIITSCSLGTQISWSIDDPTVEGVYVSYMGEQKAKMFSAITSIILPDMPDADVTQFTVTPYKNINSLIA